MLIQKQSVSFFDSDQLNDVVKGASLELQQLEKGSFHADLFSVQLGGGVLNRGYYNRKILTQGSFSKEHMTCGFIHNAPSNGSFNGETVHKYDMSLSHTNEPLEHVLAPDTLWSSFQFKQEDLVKTGIELPKNGSMVYTHNFEVQKRFDHEITALYHYLNNLNENTISLVNGDMLYNSMLSMYANTLSQSTSSNQIKRNDSYIIAHKIYQYIHEHINEPIQMITLTNLVGKSERTIERIFKKYFGVTPYTYLRLHRFKLIHRKLLQGDPSTNITHLAMQNGFMHMGHFGSDYKKIFGETPSETLKKNRK